MSHTFSCGEHTALISYLYDECEPAERAVVDAHVALCAACAAELATLESARLQLGAWAPPEVDLGFQVVRPEKTGAKPPIGAGDAADGLRPGAFARSAIWLHGPLPAWTQAVAACLLFGAGVSLGVARGSLLGRPPAVAATTLAPATAPAAASGPELAAIESRLRAEMAQLRTAAISSGGVAPQGVTEAQLLARVRVLIEESEERQRRELALRTAQVLRDFDSQRRVDLAQIQRNFGQIEGLTGAEVREQRQMLDYLMRVSEQR